MGGGTKCFLSPTPKNLGGTCPTVPHPNKAHAQWYSRYPVEPMLPSGICSTQWYLQYHGTMVPKYCGTQVLSYPAAPSGTCSMQAP